MMAKAPGGSRSSRGWGEGNFWGVSSLRWGNVPFFVILPLFTASRARPRLLSSAHRLPPPAGTSLSAGPGADGNGPVARGPPASVVGWGATGVFRGARGWETGPANPERDGIALRRQSGARRHCLSVP